MSQRAKDISRRIESLKSEVIAFVETLSDDDWKKTCEWEQWPVGVTARHLGAGHFAISKLLGMIVAGKDLPPMTMDQVHEMSKKDARKHLDCTKAEALDLLRKNGAELAAYVAGLSDDELERKASMPAFGGDVTTAQMVDYIVFQSAVSHFDSIKNALGR